MFIILLLIYFVPFTFLFQLGVSFRHCLSYRRVHFPFDSLILLWLLLQMPHSLIRTSIFKLLGYLCPFVYPGYFLCAGFILLLQELQGVALMLCQMALHFADKVVDLHLDNSTVKAK